MLVNLLRFVALIGGLVFVHELGHFVWAKIFNVKVLKFSRSGNHRPQIKKVKVLGNQRLAAGGEVKRARKRVTSIKKSAAE